MNYKDTMGWGTRTGAGVEVWDTRPIFFGSRIGFVNKIKLIFYPKKFFLYWWIGKKLENLKTKRSIDRNAKNIFRILDEGCGTGASVIEMKALFGSSVEVIGTDVIQLQVDLAQQRLREYKVDARALLYNGTCLPFDTHYFDVVHTSDVLGHVPNVPHWLSELSRVLKPGGTLAMFSESKLGKHAYIRKYLLKHGINTDPHAEFHISLYSKQELCCLLEEAGFEIKAMYTTVWAKFFVHPDELYSLLHKQKSLFFFRTVNLILYWLKKYMHPFSTALCELYCLVEMLFIGKRIESQGYVILARKR